MRKLMVWENGINQVSLLTLELERDNKNNYVIQCCHGDMSTSVCVDAETIRNMAKHIEAEEKKN